MNDIDKRGLPKYLTAYLNYKLGNSLTINEELYREVPNDLKEYIDCVAEGKEPPNSGSLAGYPVIFKEEIAEKVEESGGGDSGEVIYTINGSDLYSWMDEQEPNTPETAYKINIVNTSEADDFWHPEIGYDADSQMSTCLWAHPDIYVDFSPTTLPSDLIHMFYCFNGPTVVGVPTLTSTIEDFNSTFGGCTNLISVSGDMSGATNMDWTFYGCSSLTSVPIIYADKESLLELAAAFENCSSLTSVRFVGSNLQLYSCNTPGEPRPQYWHNYAFTGCTSLETIYVDSQETKDAIYDQCHKMDSSDTIVTEEKIIVDPTLA